METLNDNVSVVIPIYNKEDYLGRAINSALFNLDKVPGELILVDDGSTDHSLKIAQSYSDRYKNVRLISQPNKGVSVARNNGVKASKFTFIAFLDADDEWYPDHLLVLDDLLRRHPACVAYSARYEIYHSDGQLLVPSFKVVLDDKSGGLIRDYPFAASWGYSPVNSSSICIRKNAIVSVGGFCPGVSKGEDKALWLRLSMMGPIAWSPRVTSCYHLDRVSTDSNIFDDSRVWDFVSDYRYYVKYHKGYFKKSSLRHYIGYQCGQYSKRCFRHKEISRSVYYACLSLLISRGRIVKTIVYKILGSPK